MKPIDFADIRRILELRESTHVDPTPVAEVPERWALYKGENIVLRYRYPVYFLYLMSDCTLDDLPSAGSTIVDPRITDVIYASSLDKLFRRDPERSSDVNHWLRKPRDLVSAKLFLSGLFQDTLSTYRERLAALRPAYFVEPPVETIGSSPKPSSRPLHAHLAKTYSSPAGIAVLLAEAGQGKTHLTRQLAATLPSSTPIYVDSRLWRSVTPEHLTDLWKTITSSFSWFKTPIPWTADSETEFVSIMMRAGVLSLVFDGFDEYIYWNRGRLDPVDTLRTLATLADESSSGVLITSRTSFWESDVARDSGLDVAHITYRLVPFDRRHAQTFFEQRFGPSGSSTTRAMTLYDSLSSTDSDTHTGFVGRGFVLELLADLVARTDEVPALPGATSVARRVMGALCEREQERQDLPIDASRQLRAFGIFAEALAAGQSPTGELLQLAISLADETIAPDQLISLVGDDSRGLAGKLAQHPLIERSVSAHEWRIRQEQVYYDLLAEQLLLCGHPGDPVLRDFVEKILPDGKLRADIATVLVDQACARPDTQDAHDMLRFTIKKLLSYSDEVPTNSSMPEKDLATAIAMLAVNRFEPLGRPRTERTQAFLALLPSERFQALQLSGTVASMDFTGHTFSDCRFDNVAWVNCSYDASTIFTNCRFIAGRVDRCDGFGLATMTNTWSDPDASILIKTEQILASARDYEEDDLRRDISLLVRKFVPREGYGIKSLEARYLRSGTFAASPHRDAIIDAFHRHILGLHTVAGKHAVHVQEEARNDLLFYATNGVMTGALARAYEEISEKLGLR